MTLPLAAYSTSHEMSSLYRQITTADLVARFEERGFAVHSARQDNARKRDPRYVTHMVRMFAPGVQPRFVGDAVPEIVIVNSHNGRTRLRLAAGLFRLVCSNGLILPDSRFPSFQLAARHRGDDLLEAVNRTADEAARSLSLLMDVIDRWKAIQLPLVAQRQLAERARALRWGENAPFEAEQLLEARRPEDNSSDLWTVFNRVQENVTRGGIVARTADNRRQVMSRDLNQLVANLAINQSLWTAAEELAAAA